MNSDSLTIIIIFLIFLTFTNEKKFIEIKSLKSGNYFAVFDNGLYSYNSNFAQDKNLIEIRVNSSSNLIIIKHIHQEDIYIFCLINNYLYIYGENNKKLLSFKMNNLIEDELLKYEYYNIIPYNDGEKMKLIISSLKEELKAGSCFWIFGCWDYNYYYYNVYKYYNFNFKNNKLDYEFKNSRSFSIPSELLNEKNICHILDSSFTIKCIYYDNAYFFPLQYKIEKKEFKKSKIHIYYENFNFSEIASSKSDKNNYLICPLYITKNFNNKNNFTICQICNKNKDFNDCDYVDNLYEKNCSHVKSFFFKEVNNYALICKTFNEFILLIIDNDSKKALIGK